MWGCGGGTGRKVAAVRVIQARRTTLRQGPVRPRLVVGAMGERAAGAAVACPAVTRAAGRQCGPLVLVTISPAIWRPLSMSAPSRAGRRRAEGPLASRPLAAGAAARFRAAFKAVQKLITGQDPRK